jgi:hypothetical protein
MNFQTPKLASVLQEINGNNGSVATVASLVWPVMDDAAYHGLAGNIVRTLEPHTEADPVAILLSFLAMFGNLIGRQVHYLAEGDQHRAKLFVVLSGATAKGRKRNGTRSLAPDILNCRA